MKQLHLPLLTLMLTVTACTSLRRQGDEHFRNGEFEAAAQLYERAVAKDPSDTKAVDGLQRARQHVIEDRLIQVRQQRLADNEQNALDKLSDILRDEQRWKVTPGGAAYSTQTEETEELFGFFTRKIKTDLDNGMYLKAKLYLEVYRPVFAGGPLNPREQQLANTIGQRGRAHCHDIKSSSVGPYSLEFARRYCISWGDSETPAAAKTSAAPAEHGFGRIEFEGEIAGLPPESLAPLADSLLDGLKDTPFFSAEGPALKVKLAGRFTSSYDEEPAIAVHTYTEQVPYQVQVTVPYTESVTVPYTTTEPYTVYSGEMDWATHTYKQVPHTEFRTVTNYRTEPQTRYRQEWETRYRDEQRSLSYPVTQFHLNYNLSATAGMTIDHVVHEIPLSDALALTDTFHDTQNLSIGLHAKPKKAPTAPAWLQTEFQMAGGTLDRKVTSAWDAKYCQTPANLTAKAQFEAVLKCLHGTKSQPEFVDNWFSAHFGLRYDDVKRAL